jgi:2-polyprenyl-6-methoxyphenol hydroxylase-like FAD-dependent oxidoreductase
MQVLIAGGGVGGLGLAQGLRRAGIEVTVFERDPAIAVGQQGYRIHLNADGDAALRRCLPSGLFDLHLAAST